MDSISNTFDLGTLKFWALGDRVLIQQDEFKTGYECDTCGGSGKVPCEGCNGSGASVRIKAARCPNCQGEGATTCPACSGKGGLLIAPETAERRPTTGRVVSIGPDVETLNVGDNVLYSNFAGYAVDLVRAGVPIVLRILHESEIMCAMDGHLDLKTLKGKTEIAIFNK